MTVLNILKEEISNLKVELSWDQKEGSLKEHIAGLAENMMMGSSDKNYDLNLAAIIEYNDSTKPQLLYHKNLKTTAADGAVILGRDSRTGAWEAVDEAIKIDL